MKELGLYIHIPFCERKCSYCNFVSFCNAKKYENDYINALINEIYLCKNEVKDYLINTIFIGGGTPSCLQKGNITKIFNAIKENFNTSKDIEITIEANPNSITRDFVEEIKENGVNRVSVGLQTVSNILLKQIGRLHTKEQFENAIILLKKYGFNNINIDLLLGLPNQTIKDVKESIDLLLKYDIPHISAYGLIVEENTKIFKEIKDKKVFLPSEDESIKMYDYANEYLKKHGIFRYEVSNFAKKGYECKHNLKYWNREEYLGLGLVSSSYFKGIRFNNTENLKEYIEFYGKKDKEDNFEEFNDKTNQKKGIKQNILRLTKQDKIEEKIMLSLRKQEGLDLRDFYLEFGYKIEENKSREIEKLIKLNLIKIENEKIVPTNEGFHVLNQIILELI